MVDERGSREKASAELSLFWRSFELAQRPTKCLLTLGTHHYDELLQILENAVYGCWLPKKDVSV
jgi:hypothetical protein